MSYYYDYYDSDPIPTGDLGFFGNSSGGGHYWPWNGTASLGDAYLFEDEDGPVDEVASPINYLQPTILVCICLAGLVGNALVIFVIVRQVSMRKVTHFYLTSLAVVNVLYLMASVPLTSVAYALGHWPFGVSICKMNGYLTSVCLSVSVLTLVAIGLDRYFAVLHPVRSRRFRTESKAMLVIISIWVLSFLLTVPRLFLFDVIEIFEFQKVLLCDRTKAGPTARRLDTTITLVALYLLPLLVLGFCHLRIGLHLWKSRRPGAESQEVSLLALRERRKVAKIVFAITVAFGIGWLPMHVINMIEDFADYAPSVLFDHRALLVFGFGFGANAINPFLYCLLSKHFRSHFKRALECRNSPNNTRNVEGDVTPVVVFARARQNEEIVVIDVENDLDDKGNDVNDDEEVNGNGDTDVSEKSAMMGAEKHDSRCSNIYVPMPTQRKLTYLQVSPCNPDSCHGTDDNGDATTSAGNQSEFGKTLTTSTSQTNLPTANDKTSLPRVE